MKRKLSLILLTVIAVFACAFGLTACDGENADSGNGESSEHSHNFTESVVDPTCTEQGYTLYTCACGESYKDNFKDALGHTEVIDEAATATCTKTGLTEGKHCSVCGTVIIEQVVIPASHTEVIDEGGCRNLH